MLAIVSVPRLLFYRCDLTLCEAVSRGAHLATSLPSAGFAPFIFTQKMILNYMEVILVVALLIMRFYNDFLDKCLERRSCFVLKGR